MSQVIDQLAELFNQRREVDYRIAALIGAGAPGKKIRRRHRRHRRHKWGAKRGRPPGARKVNEYACEDCKRPFTSNLPLREAKCPFCQSTKILGVK